MVSTKVIILDYDSNEIICVLDSENNYIFQYSPGNQDKFYYVILHDDYNIYVTPTIQIIGEEYNERIPNGQTSVEVCLDKKNSEYTSLFQLRLNIRNFKIDESYSIVSNDYIVKFYMKNINSSKESYFRQITLPESGIISCEDCTYFSLNTDYIIDISLYEQSDKDLQLAHNSFDGSITNSNLIDIYFSINSENETEN